MLNETEIIATLGNHWSKGTPFTGWITPAGTYTACENSHHFASLDLDSRYHELIAAFREAECKEQDNQNDWRDRANRSNNGHMAWHAYDSEWNSVMESIRCFVFDAAYHDGYIRFYIDRQRKKISVEGTSEHIQRNRPALNRIVKAYDPRYELEIFLISVRRWRNVDLCFGLGNDDDVFYGFNKEFPDVEQE